LQDLEHNGILAQIKPNVAFLPDENPIHWDLLGATCWLKLGFIY
jgi:hypothetical protein